MKCCCFRYVDESMDEEYREDTKGPMVNGHAVPVKDTPQKNPSSVPRLLSMDSEDYPEENGETILQDIINEEEDTAGPLIPPPQGFRSPGHAQGRALSQSVPQVSIMYLCQHLRFDWCCKMTNKDIVSLFCIRIYLRYLDICCVYDYLKHLCEKIYHTTVFKKQIFSLS